MSDVATILDMCCGSRMFWFDKQDERAVFSDIRAEEHTLCDGRHLVISPDVIADFRALPFADEAFPVVLFDPPHLERAGENSWMRKKYGALDKANWRDDIRAGFAEAFRVLRPHGVLIFKWNETQIPVSQVISLTGVKPVIWQRTGKADKTHWIIFCERRCGMITTSMSLEKAKAQLQAMISGPVGRNWHFTPAVSAVLAALEAVEKRIAAQPVAVPDWHSEADQLAASHGLSFVVFRHGEQPQCADPTKVVLSFTDKGLGYNDSEPGNKG